jgi:DNA-binding MarR family transcriptional regulator
MKQTELRGRIIEYLESSEGDMLSSVGRLAEALGAERGVVQKLIRDMVKKGEAFEPIPRRYLRHERRVYRADAPPHHPERRKNPQAGSRNA